MLLDLLENESALEVLDRAVNLRNLGRPIINLGVGQPDARTPQHVCAAAIKAIEEGRHGYTPPLGIPALRECVADYVKRHFACDVSSNNVVITPGGKIAICWASLICASLAGEAKAEFIYPDPGFPIYASMARASGAKAVPLALSSDWGYATRAVDLKALLNENTRLLIVNSPHNPTGGVMSAEHWLEIEELLQDYPKVTVLSDEIYSDFIFAENARHASLLALSSLRERSIIVHGWSKSFAMTGWRLGWSIWPQDFIAKVFSLAVNSYSCPAEHVQYAGIAALQGPLQGPLQGSLQGPLQGENLPGEYEHTENMRKNFARRATLISNSFNAMDGVSCVQPRGAFYVYPNFAGRGLLGIDLQNRWLDEIDVAVVAGIGFGATGKHHIRISCAASDEDITEALARIETWLQKNQ